MMIGYLQGLILRRKPEGVLLLCGDVGYFLECPASTLQALPEPGNRTELHVSIHVREDAIRLFGFQNEFDKTVFETLIGVSAVGPKLALSLLGPFEGRELVEALHEKEMAQLLAIPGVGKRTLEKLLVEMGPKIEKLVTQSIESRVERRFVQLDLSEGAVAVADPQGKQKNLASERAAASSLERKNRREMLADIESALVNLGYKDKMIRGCIDWIQAEWDSSRIPQRLDESLRMILQRQSARLVTSDVEGVEDPRESSLFGQNG